MLFYRIDTQITKENWEKELARDRALCILSYLYVLVAIMQIDQ
jgi:hypothetical protein